MKTEPLSLRFIVLALLLALGSWVVGNGVMFWRIYGDTLNPLPLPYIESFADQQRVDYRQFGGKWQIEDQALVQRNDQLADLFAVVPLTIAEDQAYQIGAHIKVLSGPNGAGFLFNMQNKDEKRKSHLVRFGIDGERRYLVFGYFDNNDEFVAQGSLPSPDISQGVDLGVVVHDLMYDLIVNGQPQQQNIPLRYNGGKVALTTWFSSISFDDIAIALAGQSLQSTNTTEDAEVNVPASITETLPITVNLPFTQNFAAPVDQTPWTAFSGDWRFEPDALVQQQSDGYDYSISHAGRFTQFAFRLRFRHRQGIAGGGLLFNMPNVADKKGGHLVRYYEGRALVWGYFDEQSNFVGQGDKVVDPPGDGVHTLQVISNGEVYSVLLDDNLVVEKVPLISQQGHIGLTASQSIVAFESIEIIALAVE